MFTTEKNLLPAVALGCTVLLAAGCTDHQRLKKEVVQAAQKQEEIRSYHFTGTMDLKLDPALFQGVPPLTAGILSLLKESRIEYAGAASLTDAVQMEADIKITPKGASAPTIVPILIKDNKLYMQLPAVNKPDEYMAFPLDSTVPGSPAAADRLKNTGRLTSALSAKLFEGLDPNWLDTDNKTETLPDGTTGKHIKLEISSKNQKAVCGLHGKHPSRSAERNCHQRPQLVLPGRCLEEDGGPAAGNGTNDNKPGYRRTRLHTQANRPAAFFRRCRGRQYHRMDSGTRQHQSAGHLVQGNAQAGQTSERNFAAPAQAGAGQIRRSPGFAPQTQV
ncbi:hypothetical protein LJK87_18150 [Paenibacillus sp. P25]|nr:hypothetical protein LJK87_18150 [Paenibacillus sp. P25]